MKEMNAVGSVSLTRLTAQMYASLPPRNGSGPIIAGGGWSLPFIDVAPDSKHSTCSSHGWTSHLSRG